MKMSGKMFEILYAKIVMNEDIPKLDQEIKIRIRGAIEKKLCIHPEIFGKPLQNSLHGYRSLRIGEYRVVFRIEEMNRVKIFLIGHRKDVYLIAVKRKG